MCSFEHYPMLEKVPEFDLYYVAYLKSDPAKEPVAASYSAPGVLSEAAHKTGRAKADFELREISREEYERLKSLLQL
jgi:hypothetical protein